MFHAQTDPEECPYKTPVVTENSGSLGKRDANPPVAKPTDERPGVQRHEPVHAHSCAFGWQGPSDISWEGDIQSPV